MRSPTNQRSGPVRLLLACCGIAAVGWWLVALGEGRLAAPSPGQPGLWSAWIEQVGPITAAFALLRLLCLVAVGYVAVCMAVGLVARRTRSHGLHRLSRLICLPPLRRLLDGVVGVSLGVGALAAVAIPAVPAGASPTSSAYQAPVATSPTMSAVSTPPTMTMRATAARTGTATPQPSPPPDPGTRPAMTMVPATGAGVPGGPALPTITMHAVRPVQSTTATQVPTPTTQVLTTPSPTPPATTPPATPAPATTPPATTPAAAVIGSGSTHVVQPGDHFWSIAEETLGEAFGRSADDIETARYWQRLVTANHDQLADPSNPDLLFAGQILLIPAP